MPAHSPRQESSSLLAPPAPPGVPWAARGHGLPPLARLAPRIAVLLASSPSNVRWRRPNDRPPDPNSDDYATRSLCDKPKDDTMLKHRKLIIIAAVAALHSVPAGASSRETSHTCAVGRGTVSAASYASCNFARATFYTWSRDCLSQVHGATGYCHFLDDGVGVVATARPALGCDARIIRVGRTSSVAVSWKWQPPGPC